MSKDMEMVDTVDTEEKTGNENLQDEAGADPDQEGTQELKYTDADVDKIVQRRLARERAKIEKEQREKAREDALTAREHAIEVRERKNSARDYFREHRDAYGSIPESTFDFLDYSSDEALDKSMEAMGKLLQDHVDLIEKQRARGKTPRIIRKVQGADHTREAFGL